MTEKMILDSVFRFSREYVKHRFYSDDEERDDHGRWSGGGDSGDKALGDKIDDYRKSSEGKAEIQSVNDRNSKADAIHKEMKNIRVKQKAIQGLLKKGGEGSQMDKLREQSDSLTDKHVDLQSKYADLIRTR